MEYSLLVASKTAVVLKVGRYHMVNSFDLETKKELNAQQKKTIEWMRTRATEAINGGFENY